MLWFQPNCLRRRGGWGWDGKGKGGGGGWGGSWDGGYDGGAGGWESKGKGAKGGKGRAQRPAGPSGAATPFFSPVKHGQLLALVC